jgi:hypothetical protein
MMKILIGEKGANRRSTTRTNSRRYSGFFFLLHMTHSVMNNHWVPVVATLNDGCGDHFADLDESQSARRTQHPRRSINDRKMI